ncbi:phosphatidylserine decarboxylase [Terribacillus sp. 179-K 1B1 HS]|uniref:phosphatidylserine decarboxylase n=1 Tax=Terribacillus sp. 179-K 1B1 HS TaxID=3142388 RepID=UPI0039A1ADC8
MLKSVLKLLVELTGNHYMSRILAAFTASKYSKFLIPIYVAVYNVNKEEMRDGLASYPSLQSLFTRHLKVDVRTIDQQTKSVVSPVDGIVSDYGTIKQATAVSVKGKELLINELMGNDSKADSYEGGSYIVIYLSPQHYHRIHSPVNGTIIDSYTLGGKSYPVNKLGIKYGNRPLSTNYRRLTEIQTEYGKCALVKVGALNINSIQLTYKESQLEKGQEVGYFSFGSTVILLFVDRVSMNNLSIDQHVKVGERISLFG